MGSNGFEAADSAAAGGFGDDSGGAGVIDNRALVGVSLRGGGGLSGLGSGVPVVGELWGEDFVAVSAGLGGNL